MGTTLQPQSRPLEWQVHFPVHILLQVEEQDQGHGHFVSVLGVTDWSGGLHSLFGSCNGFMLGILGWGCHSQSDKSEKGRGGHREQQEEESSMISAVPQAKWPCVTVTSTLHPRCTC